MAPVLPEGTPVELPDDRLARGDDLRALKLSVALRGYRMDEVDWLLDRLSEQLDSRDREIARLRSVLHVEPVPPQDEPELLTHPFPAVRDVDRDDDDAAGRPRRVPEGTEVTDARPDRPARDIRTTRPPEVQ
jgi:DivIVA domain-containing protein